MTRRDIMDAGPDVLREALAVAGMPAAELARRIGVKPSTVSNWTSGYARPALDNIEAADRALEAGGRLLEAFGFSARAVAPERVTPEAALRQDPDLSAPDKRILLELLEVFRRRAR